jgi:hypothetical protein
VYSGFIDTGCSTFTKRSKCQQRNLICINICVVGKNKYSYQSRFCIEMFACPYKSYMFQVQVIPVTYRTSVANILVHEHRKAPPTYWRDRVCNLTADWASRSRGAFSVYFRRQYEGRTDGPKLQSESPAFSFPPPTRPEQP